MIGVCIELNNSIGLLKSHHNHKTIGIQFAGFYKQELKVMLDHWNHLLMFP